MTDLVFVSALARLFLVILLVRVIVNVTHMLSFRERLGIGIAGGCAFLTLAVILDIEKEGTPFDVWSGLGFTLGCLIFFSGFLARKMKHDANNEAQKDIARQHFSNRGKA